jgi:hypothetical protein
MGIWAEWVAEGLIDAATEAMPEGQAGTEVALAHALRRSLVREPDAGNPRIRFDERG